MPRWWRFSITVLVMSAIAGAGLVAVASALFGSPSEAIQYLRGSRIVVYPMEVNVGTVSMKSPAAGSFTVRNLSGERVTVLGAKVDCSCVSLDEFPMILAQGETRDIHFRIANSGNQNFARTISLYTDRQDHPRIQVVVSGSDEQSSD